MGSRFTSVKMKAALILLSVLTSIIMAMETDSDSKVKVSFGPSSSGERQPRGSARFFFNWCGKYMANCVPGCSSSSCDAVCTVSSWLATCTYTCNQVTSNCMAATTTTPAGTTTNAGTTTTVTTTTTPTCLAPNAPCDPVNDLCCSPATSCQASGPDNLCLP